MERVRFALRDNECPICNESEFVIQESFVFKHEGLDIVVEVCQHAANPQRVARDLVEDVYGELLNSRSYPCRTDPAIKGDRLPFLQYHWRHLERELRLCTFCMGDYAEFCWRTVCTKIDFECLFEVDRDVFHSVITDLNPYVKNENVVGRVCKDCLRVEGSNYRQFMFEEIRRVYKWRQEELCEAKRLQSLRKLLFQAKSELRKPSRSQEVLESLKKAFEQEGTLRK